MNLATRHLGVPVERGAKAGAEAGTPPCPTPLGGRHLHAVSFLGAQPLQDSNEGAEEKIGLTHQRNAPLSSLTPATQTP